jgi:hypothetical protein
MESPVKKTEREGEKGNEDVSSRQGERHDVVVTKGKDLSKQTLLQILTFVNDVTQLTDEEIVTKMRMMRKEQERRCNMRSTELAKKYFVIAYDDANVSNLKILLNWSREEYVAFVGKVKLVIGNYPGAQDYRQVRSFVFEDAVFDVADREVGDYGRSIQCFELKTSVTDKNRREKLEKLCDFFNQFDIHFAAYSNIAEFIKSKCFVHLSALGYLN